jgi:vacuolar-type H+-ATPase subunit I/STV1
MNKQPEQEVIVEVCSTVFQYLINMSTHVGVLILITSLLVSYIATRRGHKK